MRFYKEAGPSFHSTNSLLETETNKKSNTEKAKKFQNWFDWFPIKISKYLGIN